MSAHHAVGAGAGEPEPRAAWSQSFVEELGVLAPDVGIPRAAVRIMAWLVVCDPPEQSAHDIQSALHLSAGAFSTATRTLVTAGTLERVAHPGDRHIYYKLHPQGWDTVLRQQLRTLTRLRDITGKALQAAPDSDDRLHELHDVYTRFEDRIQDMLEQPRRPC